MLGLQQQRAVRIHDPDAQRAPALRRREPEGPFGQHLQINCQQEHADKGAAGSGHAVRFLIERRHEEQSRRGRFEAYPRRRCDRLLGLLQHQSDRALVDWIFRPGIDV